MVPTEVNNVLCALVNRAKSLCLGKHFLHSLVMGSKPAGPITVNYPDNESLGVGVGFLIGEGYDCAKDDALGYVFRVDTHSLELKVKENVNVVDFDFVDYDPRHSRLSYRSIILEGKNLERFQNKTCTLLSDPYVDVKDEKVWKEKQLALLSYINKGWKILDRDGDEVEFLIPGSVFDYLDPRVKWTTRGKVTTPAKEDLTHESFLREFDQLLTKYGMKK